MNGFMLRQPLLVVLAGRPGTGKTTLGQALASELRAAFLRIDAIETAVVRCGWHSLRSGRSATPSPTR